MIEEADKNKEPQKPITMSAYVGKRGEFVWRLSVDVNKMKIRVETDDNIFVLDKDAAHSLSTNLMVAYKMLNKL